MGFISRLLGRDNKTPEKETGGVGEAVQHDNVRTPTVWQDSPAHLLLLRHFLDGGQAKHLRDEQWRPVLNEPVPDALARFIAEGVLVQATLAQSAHATVNAHQAKEMARNLGLKVSGRKSEVIQRVLDASPDAVQTAMGTVDVLICGQEATNVVQRYLVRCSAAKEAMEEATLELVKEHRFVEAAQCVGRYEAAQVFGRGIGIDWSSDRPGTVTQLDTMFTVSPKILKELDRAELEPLRVGAAMMMLLGTNTAKKWLPTGMKGVARFDLDTAARMLVFRASAPAISHKKGTLYRVFGAPDSCAACKTFAGRLFKPQEVPEFPYEHCSHVMGCRCLLSETSDDIDALSRELGLPEL